MATYKEIRTQIAQLEAEAETLRKQELEAVLAEMREKIAELGITPDDLFGRRRARKPAVAAKKPREPKYQNPKTGETWTGMGRAPAWIAGKNRDRFLIQKG